MTGPERLAVEIIGQAARDYNTGPYQQDAKEFFGRRWFETLCDLLGADPDVIRRRIKQK
jgi:hypothetical protein